MNRVLPPLLLTFLAILTAQGCVRGNERAFIGNGEPGNTVKLTEFTDRGEPPPPSNDDVSVLSLSRANWGDTPVLVPVDGLAQKPHYVRKPLWARETARQRGQHPTATTALELTGGTNGTQVAEAAASAPLALWDGVRFVFWDAWTDPLWVERVRPMNAHERNVAGYERAPAGTPRVLPPQAGLEDLSGPSSQRPIPSSLGREGSKQ